MIAFVKPQPTPTTPDVAPYRITISTPPRRDLPQQCLTVIQKYGLAIRTLSILQDDRRRDRQNLEIVTEPCAPELAATVGKELAADEAAKLQPI